MSTLREQIARSAELGGVAVGAHLRAEGVAAGLMERAHRRRARRTVASVAASVAALALAGTVAVELLRPPADPAGPVHRGDVPSIDRIVNPEAADLFRCGVEPADMPEQGVTIAQDADREDHPTVELGVFSRYTAGGSPQVDRLPLDGSVPVDPDAAVVFATTVDWADVGMPATWGISTAGALIAGDGTVAALHDGVTVRSNLLPVLDRFRALEGGFDPYVCGGALPEGEYSAVTVIQVWEGDPSRVVATYVNPGLGDDAAVRVEDTGDDVSVSGDDEERQRQGELATRVEQEGVPLLEVESGMRAPVLRESGWSATTASCRRAESAPVLRDITVILPMSERMEEKSFGTVEIREGDDAGIWPGIWWPKDGPIPFWGSSWHPATLLLYDVDSGALVAVFESHPMVGTDVAGDEEFWVDPAASDPGCSVASELPDAPGTYRPVYVYDLGTGDGATAPDGWFLLPPFEYDGDPATLESGLGVQATSWGTFLIL